MTPVIADTNIFLRYLTNDVPAHADRITRRFREAQKGRVTMVVLPITVIEVVFHLERWYHLTRTEIAEKISSILSQPGIEADEKSAVFEAFARYATSRIDFVDLLTWTIAKERNMKVLSFDKDYDAMTPQLRLDP